MSKLERLMHVATKYSRRIIGLMSAAGFAVARLTRLQRTIFGRVAFFQGVAPARPRES